MQLANVADVSTAGISAEANPVEYVGCLDAALSILRYELLTDAKYGQLSGLSLIQVLRSRILPFSPVVPIADIR